MANSFGEFLKEKRTEKGLTQKSLSEMLFVSESAVSKWEKNVAHPDMSLLMQLSNILGVTVDELINASVNESVRNNAKYASKWKKLAFSWQMFFFISYGITLLTCFIVNLAAEGTLSWFFIVLASLIFSATFTTLPEYIKAHKIVFIPLSQFLALILLLGVCNIYTGGKWFLIATLPILFGWVCVFLPIIIDKERMPEILKENNALFCVIIDYVVLALTLLYISNATDGSWFIHIALIFILIAFIVSLATVGIIKCIKTNKKLKAGIILLIYTAFYIACGYMTLPILKRANINIENSNEFNPFKFNFSSWKGNSISNNVTFIVFLCLAVLSIIFIISGIIKAKKR